MIYFLHEYTLASRKMVKFIIRKDLKVRFHVLGFISAFQHRTLCFNININNLILILILAINSLCSVA